MLTVETFRAESFAVDEGAVNVRPLTLNKNPLAHPSQLIEHSGPGSHLLKLLASEAGVVQPTDGVFWLLKNLKKLYYITHNIKGM